MPDTTDDLPNESERATDTSDSNQANAEVGEMKPFDPGRVAFFVAEVLSSIMKRQLDERGRKGAEDAEWIVELLLDGMYQGKLVVQGKEWSMQELATWGWFGIVDHAARFEIVGAGKTGYGLHEHGFFGPFPKYGLT